MTFWRWAAARVWLGARAGRGRAQQAPRAPRRLARPRSRIEYFVFMLLAEMRGHEVQLYAIKRDGALNRYPRVDVVAENCMPSGGDLSNPNDQALVKGLEDKMIEAYGTALVELKCKAAVDGRWTSATRCSAPSTWARSSRRWSATRSPGWT